MSLTNLNNVHLDDAKKTAANEAMTQLEAALAAINVNLTSEDRKRYGSINELHKLVVNKVQDYHQNQPELQTPQINWNEFEKDFASRSFLEAAIHRLEGIVARLNNAKILHDYDNYHAALSDYAYTTYMAGGATPGFETKMNEMKQFFAKGSAQKTIINGE